MKTQARFTGKWVVEVTVEPGSVPDRAVPYSKNKTGYRPVRLVMEFTASAPHDDPRALRPDARRFRAAVQDDLRLSSLIIHGHRLKKDGTPGQQVTDEKFWQGGSGAPDWAAEAVRITLEALRGGSSS